MTPLHKHKAESMRWEPSARYAWHSVQRDGGKGGANDTKHNKSLQIQNETEEE